MANPLHEQIIKEVKEKLKIAHGELRVEYESTTPNSSYETGNGAVTGTLRNYKIIRDDKQIATYRIFTCGKPMIMETKIIT